jgi:REP element-mobilizing transposase RayT
MEDAGRFFNPEADIDKRRNRLPHWQQGDVWCFVTWRLADALPSEILFKWKEERKLWLRQHPEPWDEQTEAMYHRRFSRPLDQWLDQGRGACLLRNPACSSVVASALRHFDQERYLLRDFVVMPNHVHVLFLPLGQHRLSELVKGWKGFTARSINRETGGCGEVWQADYWDRLIRSGEHFERVVSYIGANPTKAGLKEGEFVLGQGRCL